ncbi:exopolyphosphatase [Aestuariirhabdus litorea]|uniref:Exopolyphosphatase n=2 Tax=Aestuariirhabdus litorea TaxID=2528527 RepID=A0A3P3VML7_9GAMM|nr:exopolyphosphatase [Aestuariirhabdus litorea]RWW93678.1 exopolyphosphatase [Endozoicomonadaceae bacterium GTF-13]
METQAVRQDDKTPGLIAAIDLGSNSFHLIVARYEEGEIRPIERIGEKIQLAAGIDEEGNLDQRAMRRGWACLRRFSQYIEGMKPDLIRIVGTKALRMARNRRVFTRTAESILKCPVEVISGREEARLIYLGASHTQSDDHGQRLVVDIGGGSTELIIGERFEPKLLESLHMGCVVYSARFFPDGVITAERFDQAYYAARLEVLNVLKNYRRMGWDEVLGSSGTIKSVEQVLVAGGVTQQGITRAGMETLRQRVIEIGHVDQIQLEGLKPDRANIFPAGLAILTAVFDALRLKRMQYSDGALREGLLYDMVGSQQHEYVRERTLNALMRRYRVDKKHARRVRKQALVCFRQVAESWRLGAYEREILSTAAWLHELGMAVSHTRYHKHGDYLVRHSDMLGFTSYEQRAIALLIRGHRRSLPMHLYENMSPYYRERVVRLTILLRLSIVLNHIRSEDTLPEYQLSVEGTRLTLDLGSGWLHEHPLIRADFAREVERLAVAGYSLLVQ